MNIAAHITRSFERLRLRGAPTLLRLAARSPLKRSIATVRLPAGQSISFPAWDPYWARHLYTGVPYEPDVESIFRRFAPGRILVDCGANIGYWSVRARELGFRDNIAIEANPSLIPFLERNVPGKFLHAAVHRTSGESLMIEGEGAAASLGTSGKPVRSIALRALGLAGSVVVKLDVEGAEIAAIEGAGDLDAIYVYEDWPRSGMPVTRYLLRQGYAVFGHDMSRIAAHEDAFAFNGRTTSVYGPSNFIAMREPA